jgi:hypothetical protein
VIVFIDESGLSERPTRVRTWAPKGQTPIIQFHFNWTHISVIAGLSRTNCLFRLHHSSIKKEQHVEFLKALHAHVKQRLLIIWDGAQGTSQQTCPRVPGLHRRRCPDGILAAVLARPQSGGIPLGLAQAACACQLLPRQLGRTQDRGTKQAQERPATTFDHRRVLGSSG